MRKRRSFSIKERIYSFRHAFRGLYDIVRHEHNARIHLLATIVVGVLCFVFEVSSEELLWLVFSIVLVWITELINSALEELSDEVSEEHRDRIRRTKDYGAAGVLLASLFACVVGGYVLLY